MSLPEKEKILIQNAILKQINEIDLSLSQVGETETVESRRCTRGRQLRLGRVPISSCCPGTESWASGWCSDRPQGIRGDAGALQR